MDARQLHLYEHAENGRAVALAELVDRHPTLDLDWLNPEGGYETALGVAARHGGAPGQLRCAELLLSRGASTSAATYQGLLPLTAAAISGYDKMVSLLLERKADIGAMDFSLCGATALHAVCVGAHDSGARGQLACADALLSNGAPLDAVDGDGWTPLMQSALLGHSQMIEKLLAAGASTAPRVTAGFSAYVGHNALEIAQGITKLVFPNDADAMTAAAVGLARKGDSAAVKAFEDVAKLLLTSGSSPSRGESAMRLGASPGTVEGAKGSCLEHARPSGRNSRN